MGVAGLEAFANVVRPTVAPGLGIVYNTLKCRSLGGRVYKANSLASLQVERLAKRICRLDGHVDPDALVAAPDNARFWTPAGERVFLASAARPLWTDYVGLAETVTSSSELGTL